MPNPGYGELSIPGPLELGLLLSLPSHGRQLVQSEAEPSRNPRIWFRLRRPPFSCQSHNGARQQGFAPPRQTPPRPCFLRAVVPGHHSRRTAPPGTRYQAVFVLRKDENQVVLDKTSMGENDAT
jgi:hypothetical protein